MTPDDVLKCPRGKRLKPGRRIKHSRFFTSRARDCRGCDLAALCLLKGRTNKAVVLGDDYPALLRARRRRERWTKAEHQLYQRQRWRSEGFHGEAKAWHGLARAVRRGLDNMRIQAFLTAAAINLKRWPRPWLLSWASSSASCRHHASHPSNAAADQAATLRPNPNLLSTRLGRFFNGPWVHKTANVLNALPKSVYGKAKQDLHAIYEAENRATAEAALDRFVAKYGPKYAKAAACLTKDRDALLAFYAAPAEHRKHVRTTNPIESTFATVRLRTAKTKGCLSRQTALAMVFKLAKAAERHWRRLDGTERLAQVIAGVHFRDGEPVQATEEQAAA
ncbi:MAG: hypothetical protein K0S35_765 [Geminicoccaceae bacterium]|jgi:hypothetical protein|nr:hypothetical protein [Geminicoccaceae bacterium]